MIILMLVFAQTSSILNENFNYLNSLFSSNMNHQVGEFSEYFDTIRVRIALKRPRLFFPSLKTTGITTWLRIRQQDRWRIYIENLRCDRIIYEYYKSSPK